MSPENHFHFSITSISITIPSFLLLKMNKYIVTSLLLWVVLYTNAQKSIDKKLYGFAAEQFTIGSVLYEDKLNDPSVFNKNWVVQMSKADSNIMRYARIEAKKLHVHDPRGCTIWLKNKLKGAIMISYKVTASSNFNESNNIVPRDINQFWMAQTPDSIDVNAKGGLFDAKKYNGEFKSYDPLQTYYASTGGGHTTDYNKTIRLRRYPRKINNVQVAHQGANSRDDDKAFLIQPDKEYLIQLVAADDIVQYIFNGKIVYQLKKGDNVDIFNDAHDKVSKGIWGEAPYTLYTEGYFGFRMTRTHHTYRDFKVYQLIKN